MHRYDLTGPMESTTAGRCHVLHVVEGMGVALETQHGGRSKFHFGETFVVPAAAEHYRLIPMGSNAKVILAYVK